MEHMARASNLSGFWVYQLAMVCGSRSIMLAGSTIKAVATVMPSRLRNRISALEPLPRA